MLSPGRLAEVARAHAAAWLVFIVCLSATVIMALQVRETATAKDEIRYNLNVDRLKSELTRRIATYVAMLRAGAGLLAAQPDIGRDGFHQFVKRIELQSRYPGVQGFGFSRRILPAELSGFTSTRRVEDPGFHVWPETPRSEYHAIVFLEPLDRRNQAAIGFDMFTEPVRRAAMVRARDTGLPAATGRVTLVQEIDSEKQSGFLIYVPVYDGGDVPATVDERRALLRGYVYSPFRMGDLLRGIFGTEQQPRVGFELHDERPEPARLLFRSPGFDPRARFRSHVTMDVAGRTWDLQLTGTPALEDASARSFVSLVLFVGICTSVLLSALTAMQTRARRRLEQSERRLEELIERERELRGEAERVSKIKDEFLATLSHELRTPLNAIIGWVHLLLDGGLAADAERRALVTVNRNARQQARLIDDLLDMSRIVSGKVSLDVREMDLNDTIEAAINVVRPAAIANKISIEASPDRTAPRVLGDAGRLQQVFWNLLSNAVKFTPEGGRVHIALRHTDRDVQAIVSDTGIGIDPAFLPHVFDRFRQGDGSSTREHGGLGLGLSIVKSLVEMHGGNVQASSAGIGHGSTFTISLRAVSAPLSRTLQPGAVAQRSDQDISVR